MKNRVIATTVRSSAVVIASLWVGVLFCILGIHSAVARRAEPALRALRGILPGRKGRPLFQQFSGLHQTATSPFMVGFAVASISLVCMTHFHSLSREPQIATA